MAQLKTQCQSYFLEQLAVLEEVAIALAQFNLNSELQQHGKQEAHKLAGSLGIFGLQEGSVLARRLEMLLMPENRLGQTQATQFSEWLNQLQKELQPEASDKNDRSVEHVSQKPLRKRQQTTVPPLPGSPFLLIIDGDRTLTDLIQLEGNHRGFQVAVAESIAAGKEILSTSSAGAALQNQPNLILLDLPSPGVDEERFQFLIELTREMPEIPVVVLSRYGEIDARVKAAEWGSAAFLQKPLLPQQIFAVIEPILQSWKHKQRVMVVDDDSVMLAAVAELLESRSLKVTALSDPKQFWKTLIACMPDLLILDIEMPNFNGIQLCRVVRNDPQWAHLPILVLTAHQERDIRNQAIAAGVDEYISKPYNPVDLVAQITRWLERTRLPQL
ncbi:response regulator [Leptolyngbya ohadii]|uniref:response regulator n=1 Tax=Leptolyngbya ohadii TaxID=1962290 RepID=UPI000B59EA05|nr:response regulator [Leptolyngbya ohadii]